MAAEAALVFDLGTTNWKAGLFCPGEKPLLSSQRVETVCDEDGYAVYHPEALWQAVCRMAQAFPAKLRRRVTHVGVTGMAEAGLLVDRQDGHPLTPILPWSDPRGGSCVERIPDCFAQTGLPKHGKYSLMKLAALRSRCDVNAAWWLGVPEYVLWRMTGVRQTDPTLAARTYAYRVDEGCWNRSLLHALDIDEAVFAPVAPTGAPAGIVKAPWGLAPDAEAAICGHDHLAAAYALDALNEHTVFLSAGTAQVVLSVTHIAALEKAHRDSGVSYGPLPKGQGWACLGSIQAGGGSMNHWQEWLGLERDAWWTLAQAQSCEPVSLVYLPYLAGSGAPHMDPTAVGWMCGLTQQTTRAQLVQAVIQGVALETRWVMEHMGMKGRAIRAVGGLARQQAYMQRLANALDAEVSCPACEEATLEGAAMLTLGKRWHCEDGTLYRPNASRESWERAYCTYNDMVEYCLNSNKESERHEKV